ncbi:MAG: hypothetical protein QME47_07035 [Candidatus Thermoplasmatota archaeon]|nr:hypothetical protein [Candidatus Thermoplasmatota archaeon]
MLDLYEIKYGYVNSAMADPEPGASASNVVNGQGWQNPMIYNARYAVLIGGGGGAPKDVELTAVLNP